MCSKALQIQITLQRMIKCMPRTSDTEVMVKLMNNVVYKSPEVCDNYWNDIHSYVSRTYVDYSAEWQTIMRAEYHKGLIDYRDKFWV